MAAWLLPPWHELATAKQRAYADQHPRKVASAQWPNIPIIFTRNPACPGPTPPERLLALRVGSSAGSYRPLFQAFRPLLIGSVELPSRL